MAKKVAICLCLALVMASYGCITTAEMKLSTVKDWIGRDREALTSSWGTPYKTTSTSDATYLSYKRLFEHTSDLDVYTFKINRHDIIEDITLKRVSSLGLEVDHWPRGTPPK